MLRVKNKLTVFDDNDGVFSDYSREALDYARDTFTVTLDSSTSYLYVGFFKPINVFYANVSTANTEASVLSGEYYNGTAWANLDGFYDETNAFFRSGFIQWSRNQDGEAKTTVNSIELYWYRFSVSVTSSATTFSGLNIVFSDDNDLKREYYEVSDFLPTGETSHILTHVATRDHIIQFLRNSGHFKESNNTGNVYDITAFDLLDIGQIKLAATYLALSKIFLSVQDNTDDVFLDKSKHFLSLYNSAIRTFYLDLDQNDNGITETSEKLASATGRLIRR